jgi:alpha-tubulin suppressor-like RCC1 family protein
MNTRATQWFLVVGALASACVGGPEAEGISNTVAAITTVPTGVQCIRVTVQPMGGAASTTVGSVVPGTPATVDLGALPEGPTAFDARAYNLACAGVGDTTPADWVTDAVTVTVRRGYLNTVNLTFRPQTQVRATGDFVVPARSVHAGGDRTFAVMQDGTVRAWGNNDNYALGDGSFLARLTPVTVPGLANVRQVVSGQSHGCAVTVDGVTSCWGLNTSVQAGSVGPSIITTPTVVPGGLPPLVQLSAGAFYTCGVGRTSPGSPHLMQAWCWGANNFGQLGTGAPSSSQTPIPVFSGAQEIATRDNPTCVLTDALGVWCTGLNNIGQFANGTVTPSNSFTSSQYYQPEQVAVGGNNHSCTRNLAGNVFCAGNNSSGQLGNGSTTASSTPVAMSITNVAQVEAGTEFTCALKTDGTVWCAGKNDNGQLGVSNPNSMVSTSAVPVRVTGLDSVTQITLGTRHACALRTDGTVWCWGRNAYGQLGDGSTRNRFAPVQVRF